MCGKNPEWLEKTENRLGSPPHVREKHVLGFLQVSKNGITPACAGKTRPLLSQKRLSQDHPRMCGKNSISSTWPYPSTGSPPHVREKRCKDLSTKVDYRITPACAGKTEHFIH